MRQSLIRKMLLSTMLSLLILLVIMGNIPSIRLVARKWLEHNDRLTSFNVTEYAVLTFLLVITAGFYWLWLLIEKIDNKTRELRRELKQRLRTESALAKSERELRQSNERYHQITQALTDYIHIVHIENGRIRKIEHSDTSAALTGYSPKDFYADQHLWINMVLPDDRERAQQQLDACLAGGKLEPIEYRIIRKDEKTRWVRSVLVRHYDHNDNIVSCDVLLKDITERKLIEENVIMAQQQAERANQAKSNFLANMSHEIKTPMNAIIGFSEILAEEHLTKPQKEYVTFIKHNAKNLLGVIDDILDYSKIESGKLDVEIANCDLPELIIEIKNIMCPLANKKQIDFAVIPQTDLPKKIKTDPARLQQCLANLLDNAIKFTEKGYAHLKLSLQEKTGSKILLFEVEDTGIGIPEDKQELIFNAFTQVESGTARRYGGTGLGLTITKQLTEMLKGKLSVKSTPGKGSIFTIALETGIAINETELISQQDFVNMLTLPNTCTDKASSHIT